jgi:hypothetical protein
MIINCCVLSFLCITALLTPAMTATQSRGDTAALSFDGTPFIHRWSKNAQHEFTPAGEEDLAKWTAMLTINVHDGARTGEQLAELANRVLGNYQQAGKVIRTDSKPRTETSEAEHFAVALLPNPAFLEAAFARVLMHEKRAVVVVYSKRFYGDSARGEMGAWLKKNGAAVEQALMSWIGIPSLARLRALPQ